MSPNIEGVKGLSETSQHFWEFKLQEISIKLVTSVPQTLLLQNRQRKT